MSNLETLLGTQKHKLLLVGQSGTGKSCASLSLPGKKYVFDFDNKLGSAASFYSQKDPSVLKDTEFTQFTLNKRTADPYEDFQKDLTRVEALAQSGKFPYAVVSLDSLTLYCEALMAHVVKKNPGIKRAIVGVPALQDYLIAQGMVKNDLGRVLALPCDVVCIAHSTTIRDEETGSIKTKVLLSGQLADYVPRIFTEVWWAVKKKGEDGKIGHYAITRSEQVVTRTQIPNIPDVIPLDLNLAKTYLAQLSGGKDG